MENKSYTVFGNGNYIRFSNYCEARDYATKMESEANPVVIVETELTGKRRGQQWTVYRSPSLPAEY